jgi:hypothetical protein
VTPRSVSRFESNLLRLLQCFLGRLPLDQARPLLAERRPAPPCLSADCVQLVKDTLAKGCVLFLARGGSWRNDRYLRSNEPVRGRVWRRIPADERPLSFSRHVLNFLVRVTAEPVTDTKPNWTTPAAELTPGDLLFFLMVQDAIADEPFKPLALRTLSLFGENPLCRLAVPDLDAAGEPNFDPWFTGMRAAILECLQPWLAERWLAAERQFGKETDWDRLGRRGKATAEVLTAFLAAADRHGRRDLARFVLRAASRILTVAEVNADFWSGGLKGEGPPQLQTRINVRRAAMAVPAGFATLEKWTRAERAVGYFDEGYAASQMWKDDWEAASGDVAAANAKRVLTEVEPLGSNS